MMESTKLLGLEGLEHRNWPPPPAVRQRQPIMGLHRLSKWNRPLPIWNLANIRNINQWKMEQEFRVRIVFFGKILFSLQILVFFKKCTIEFKKFIKVFKLGREKGFFSGRIRTRDLNFLMRVTLPNWLLVPFGDYEFILIKGCF
jgi:hypothetical protein